MFEHGVGIKNPLFFIGVVENNNDLRKERRVQVRAFGIHGTNSEVSTEDLPWAICIKGDYDPNGFVTVPAVDAWVFGFFLDGRDAQQPMILGLIPTQNLTTQTPIERGWGRIPAGPYNERLAVENNPENYGQPSNSRLCRGEDIHETYVLGQEMGRITNVKVGGSEETWSEPAPAYNAQYPLNRVIQTSCHSIEIDDSPGAERIMITHGSGSYVQIDNRGTTTHKSVSDKFEINDRKQHVYIGGMSTVTINGNSYVYVKGNKIEEIEGDLQTLVHGNHMLSVGGQSTINAGEQAQMRGADVKLHANVGTMSIKAGKELNISAGGLIGLPPKYGAVTIKAEKIILDATDKLHMRGNTQVNIQSVAEMNLSAISINQLSTTWAAQSLGSTNISSAVNTSISGLTMNLGGGATTNINSAIVNISTLVNLAPVSPAAPPIPLLVAPKFAIPPYPSTPFVPVSSTPEFGWSAAPVQAPEPVSKSTSINPIQNEGSMGSTGYSAKDHSGEGGGRGGGYNGTGAIPTTPISSATQSAITPLLDFIAKTEGITYDRISTYVNPSNYPSKPITQLTIGQLLDWMESIDDKQNSEASGRYQIVEDTLRGYDNGDRNNPLSPPSYYKPLYTAAGLTASDLFSPINQDKMAIALLRGAGLDRYLAGTMSKEAFANAIAGVWASMPIVDGKNTGESVYEGTINGAYNSAKGTSVQAYLSVLDQIKARNDNVITQQQSGPF